MKKVLVRISELFHDSRDVVEMFKVLDTAAQNEGMYPDEYTLNDTSYINGHEVRISKDNIEFGSIRISKELLLKLADKVSKL